MLDVPNLVRVDPATMTVEADLAFSSNDESPSDLAVSPNGQTLYYLNTNLYSLEIGASAIPSSSLANAGSDGFYKMDVHPSSGAIFVSDAIDFAQNGKVYKYDNTGTRTATYDVGIVPGSYHFIGD